MDKLLDRILTRLTSTILKGIFSLSMPAWLTIIETMLNFFTVFSSKPASKYVTHVHYNIAINNFRFLFYIGMTNQAGNVARYGYFTYKVKIAIWSLFVEAFKIGNSTQ